MSKANERINQLDSQMYLLTDFIDENKEKYENNIIEIKNLKEKVHQQENEIKESKDPIEQQQKRIIGETQEENKNVFSKQLLC